MEKCKPQIWSKFSNTWRKAESLAVVCKKTGLSKSAASSLASRMRSCGWKLKLFGTKHGHKKEA